MVNITTTEHGIMRCILKLENTKNNCLSDMACQLDLYNREYYFYQSISPYVSISVPTFHGIIKDDDMKNIGILLEYLDIPLNVNLNIAPIEHSISIISHLAKFHGCFSNKDLKVAFPLLKTHNDPVFQPSWNQFIQSKVLLFKQTWSNILESRHLLMVDFISNRFQEI